MTPEDTEWQKKALVKAVWYECRKVYKSEILLGMQTCHPLFQAGIVHLLIDLNDLLQKAADVGRRVSFADQVQVTPKIVDVTDLVRQCRNAACHAGTKLDDVDFGKFRFLYATAGRPLIVIGGVPQFICEFDDDMAIFYGDTRIYLRRHIGRALDEVGRALEIEGSH